MEKQAQDIITRKGGTVIEGPFVLSKQIKYRIRCQKGHEWEPWQKNIIYCNSWCPYCCANSHHTIDMLQKHAEDLGGKCLSVKYTNNRAKYSWQCGQCTNEWEATWANVKNCNSWCPKCKNSIREEITRAAFEENFPGERFDKNQHLVGMELDGYCKNLNLGFEHDGMQHRVRVPHFQPTEEDFQAQIERDKQKDELCLNGGITLIRVPDRGVLSHKDIRNYVRNQILDLGYDVPVTLPSDIEFFQSVQCSRIKGDKYLAKADAIVRQIGGVLESIQCPIRSWPLYVTCSKNHGFTTTFDQLDRKRWCPECSSSRPKEEEEIANVVEQRGYKYVSTRSSSSTGRPRRMITIQCREGHPQFEMMWDNFRAGKGCLACGTAARGKAKRITAEAVQLRANQVGLIVKESTYTSVGKPATFVCKQCDHTFISSLKKAEMAKTNCPMCLTKEFFPVILQGKLEEDNDSAKTRLKWRCGSCSNEFETTLRGMCARKYKCPNTRCSHP